MRVKITDMWKVIEPSFGVIELEMRRQANQSKAKQTIKQFIRNFKLDHLWVANDINFQIYSIKIRWNSQTNGLFGSCSVGGKSNGHLTFERIDQYRWCWVPLRTNYKLQSELAPNNHFSEQISRIGIFSQPYHLGHFGILWVVRCDHLEQSYSKVTPKLIDSITWLIVLKLDSIFGLL